MQSRKYNINNNHNNIMYNVRRFAVYNMFCPILVSKILRKASMYIYIYIYYLAVIIFRIIHSEIFIIDIYIYILKIMC